MLRRVVSTLQSSTGYIDTPRCTRAILQLLGRVCAENDALPTWIAAKNAAVAEEAGAAEAIQLALTSSTASNDVLIAARGALKALQI